MSKETPQPPQPELIKLEDLQPSEFRTYKKTGVTRARVLTETDYQELNGTIDTLEGPSSFTVGDYLAVGIKGEKYPIRAETMASTKKIIGEPDNDGWANYDTTTTVRALKINKPFAVQRIGTNDISVGKTGDYFVDSGKRQFIVDSEIFLQTYVEVNQN
jgi:hypothetical protein